jgi:ubiquinone/menaquinone biosynthesis C-methylase UbiE
MKIEAIPNPVTGIYAFIARKNPCIRDIHKEVAKEVCAKLSSGWVLDLGTGPGYLPFEIAKRAPDLKIIGIDLSSGMIDIAGKKANELGLAGRVTFETANASSLPFEDGSFDLVISTLSLHHWRDPKACFKEIYRVLKNNAEADIFDLRRDTTKEVNAEFRQRYGWFLYFLFLKFVRAHSSMTLRHAEDILSSVDAPFSKKSAQGIGVVIKLELVK